MPTIGIEGQYNKGAAAPINRPIQVDTNGNLIITPLSGSTTDVNITKIAGNAVNAGAGAVSTGTLRITLGNDDTQFGAVGAASDVDGNVHGQLRFCGEELDDIHDECIDILSSVQAMDDWDESDRAKVNPIVGQAGVAAGAGVVDALTQRITHASDDPVTTAVQLIDDAVYTDGSGTPSKGILIMGTDGTNPQALSVNSDGELKVNLETADIEIGAVEIKNATDDTRATVNANGLCVDINGQTLTAVKISKDANANAANNAMFAQLSDGTNALGDATHPLPISATAAANAVGNTIFVSPVVNGSAIAAAKPMPISATEAANAVTNPVFARLSQDGTNAVAAAYPLPISATMAANAAGNPIYVSGTVAATNKPATVNATGAGAIATTTAISEYFKLVSVTVHFSLAPTTAGNLTISKDALAGAPYDVVLNTIDATLGADIVYIPDGELLFVDGDEIAVAYANADGRTYGLEITYVKV